MSDDSEIVDEIRRTEDAVRCHPDRPRVISSFFRMHAPIEKTIWDALAKSLGTHSLFSFEGDRIFGSNELRLDPTRAARLLLNKAQQVGADQAVQWLRKVYTATHADIRHVAEVRGLDVDAPYQLSNGVQFLRISELPQSRISDHYKWSRERRAATWFDLERKMIAAIHVLPNVPEGKTVDRNDAIDRAVCAHVLLSDNAAPVVGTSWVEFVDPEMEDANPFLLGLTQSSFDGQIPYWSEFTVYPGLVPKIEAFLSLSRDVLAKADVAASRLIMARNRMSPANCAIDGCICLEALLTDAQPGEHTYKLALRAALLLGGNLEERRTIRKTVESFYALRSTAVHGTHRAKSTDRETSQNGLEICARVLRNIVIANKIPDWKSFELGGDRGAISGC